MSVEWNENKPKDPSSSERQLTLDYDGEIKEAMKITEITDSGRFTVNKNGECLCDGVPIDEWLALQAEYDAHNNKDAGH